eukprot:TRINITY_DN17263_c0_g1_i2.p1 TRINITY_DN17263_c0_g1~~TRINITY_DN17263_c0_g1_i2.p1  ORF type:complete len:718 (-),score=138.90 TRINITY_DN17263_c0_g1_i2:285-2438(-)
MVSAASLFACCHQRRKSALLSRKNGLSMASRAFLSTKIIKVDAEHRVPHVDLLVDYAFNVKEYSGEPLEFGAKEVVAATDACWNRSNTETSYQPGYICMMQWNKHVGSDSLKLSKADIATMSEFSELARNGAKYMHEHTIRGKIFSLEQAALEDDGTKNISRITTKLVQGFLEAQRTGRADDATQMARKLNDCYIGIGWLEKYFLFEQYDKTGACKDVYLPAHTLARPYTLLARIFGNHEEFTYYNHYVGSSCSNMEEMRNYMKEHVDFNDRCSIKRWVLRFKGLYDFQLPYHPECQRFTTEESLTLAKADPDNMPVPMSEFLISERYFRFIHLAMEMIWSDKVGEVHELFHKATKGATGGQKEISAMLTKAFELLLEVERRMNLTFKTLVLGSEPRHYNRYVRPYIAGTWGRNCGTVYDLRGKFFEGLGDETYELQGKTLLGKWKRHVGQTGAGTSVRPIGDEFAGGVSDVYTKPLASYFCLALMRDQQAKVAALCEEAVAPPEERDEASIRAEIANTLAKEGDMGTALEAEDRLQRPEVSSLALMLTMFRAVTRPYSHNQQIQQGKTLATAVQGLVVQFPDLKLLQLKLQMACLTHRLDHYRYVHTYINGFKPSGNQLRTAATGGSNTTDFLPDLIDSNMDQARKMLRSFGGQEPGTMMDTTLKEMEKVLDESARVTGTIRLKSSNLMKAETEAQVKKASWPMARFVPRVMEQAL